eukprot:gene3358-4219_t
MLMDGVDAIATGDISEIVKYSERLLQGEYASTAINPLKISELLGRYLSHKPLEVASALPVLRTQRDDSCFNRRSFLKAFFAEKHKTPSYAAVLCAWKLLRERFMLIDEYLEHLPTGHESSFAKVLVELHASSVPPVEDKPRAESPQRCLAAETVDEGRQLDASFRDERLQAFKEIISGCVRHITRMRGATIMAGGLGKGQEQASAPPRPSTRSAPCLATAVLNALRPRDRGADTADAAAHQVLVEARCAVLAVAGGLQPASTGVHFLAEELRAMLGDARATAKQMQLLLRVVFSSMPADSPEVLQVHIAAFRAVTKQKALVQKGLCSLSIFLLDSIQARGLRQCGGKTSVQGGQAEQAPPAQEDVAAAAVTPKAAADAQQLVKDFVELGTQGIILYATE